MPLIYSIQVLTGGVGGVMCALQIMGTVFETALFMASFGLSGFFLLTHLFMLNDNLAAKYPKLGIIVSILHKDLYEKSNISLKLLPLQHMMYLLLGTVLSLVLTIYRFLAWSLVSVKNNIYKFVFVVSFGLRTSILHAVLGTFVIIVDMPLDSVNCIYCGPC